MTSYFAQVERKFEPFHRKDRLRKRGAANAQHLTFEMRHQHEKLRASHGLRTQAHTDRVRFREAVINHVKQNDARTELEYIQGLSSRMALPPHLRTRLADLQNLGVQING